MLRIHGSFSFLSQYCPRGAVRNLTGCLIASWDYGQSYVQKLSTMWVEQNTRKLPSKQHNRVTWQQHHSLQKVRAGQRRVQCCGDWTWRRGQIFSPFVSFTLTKSNVDCRRRLVSGTGKNSVICDCGSQGMKKLSPKPPFSWPQRSPGPPLTRAGSCIQALGLGCNILWSCQQDEAWGVISRLWWVQKRCARNPTVSAARMLWRSRSDDFKTDSSNIGHKSSAPYGVLTHARTRRLLGSASLVSRWSLDSCMQHSCE